jgi:hypothetical protein
MGAVDMAVPPLCQDSSPQSLSAQIFNGKAAPEFARPQIYLQSISEPPGSVRMSMILLVAVGRFERPTPLRPKQFPGTSPKSPVFNMFVSRRWREPFGIY